MNHTMTPEDFIQAYEQALGTQDWSRVEPLIHNDACVTFSDGSVHKGSHEVKKAFERNFSLIKEEEYSITNVYWVHKDDNTSVYLFDFHWSGVIDGKQAGGSGRGTSVLIMENTQWKLLVEHLGPKSNNP
jgi:ketosteroid isomerase-like protein